MKRPSEVVALSAWREVACFPARTDLPFRLARLSWPVRPGSWNSIYDPATTEWMREHGHGSALQLARTGANSTARNINPIFFSAFIAIGFNVNFTGPARGIST